MAEQNRCKELESLLASFQNPGQAMPIPELADYLRLVRDIAVQCSEATAMMLRPVLLALQVRDLRVRDSENVVTHGASNLQKLAAAVPEEECKLTNTHKHMVHGCVVLPSSDCISIPRCLVQCG